MFEVKKGKTCNFRFSVKISGMDHFPCHVVARLIGTVQGNNTTNFVFASFFNGEQLLKERIFYDKKKLFFKGRSILKRICCPGKYRIYPAIRRGFVPLE